MQDENIFQEMKPDGHAWCRIKKPAGSLISILIHVGNESLFWIICMVHVIVWLQPTIDSYLCIR